MNYELLNLYCSCFAPSGRESKLRAIIEKTIEGISEEIRTDVIGNLIVRRAGQGKKIMLTAHMDEPSLMITSVSEGGFLRFCKIGGTDNVCLADSRVVFSNGIRGSIQWKNMEFHSNLRLDDMYIDIAAMTRDDAEKFARVGDSCVLCSSYYENEDIIEARNLSSRSGCFILTELLKQEKNNDYDIYYVFTAQKETEGRGAGIAAFEIKPDIAITIESTPTGDIPVSDSINIGKEVKLKGGPSIRVMDGNYIADKRLCAEILETAKEHGIICQSDILYKSGTEAAKIQQSAGGCSSAIIGVPVRYINTANEMMSKKDIESTTKLVINLLRNI